MNDYPTTLRVIASYKAGEDLAERFASAVAVQQSMAAALNKAADEIERLQACLNARIQVAMPPSPTLTDAEREAVESAIESLSGVVNFGVPALSPESAVKRLRSLLGRMT